MGSLSYSYLQRESLHVSPIKISSQTVRIGFGFQLCEETNFDAWGLYLRELSHDARVLEPRSVLACVRCLKGTTSLLD